MPHEELPFWKFNVPEGGPTECPPYLCNLSDKDQRLIGMWDSDYVPMTWPEIQDIIRTNQIDLFRRSPSHLRRYRQYIYKMQKEHGGVIHFILKERLKWDDLAPKGAPFTHPDDIKTLWNDWPYGVDSKVVHLVVWTKFDLDDDPKTGHLKREVKDAVDDYVTKTFCSRVLPDNVIWFKSWRSLKSVHAVEHFHVMLYDPDPAFIDEITGGDKPMVPESMTNEGEWDGDVV